MKNKLELNKYDKKTLELQKEILFIQNRAEKKGFRAVLGKVT